MDVVGALLFEKKKSVFLNALQFTLLLQGSDACQPSATVPQETFLTDDIVSQHGKLMDPSPLLVPVVLMKWGAGS